MVSGLALSKNPPQPLPIKLNRSFNLDIKSTSMTSSPMHDPTIVVDANTNRLHPSTGRGHHRKASSVSAHLSPRSSRPSSGNDHWAGDWKEGKEW